MPSANCAWRSCAVNSLQLLIGKFSAVLARGVVSIKPATDTPFFLHGAAQILAEIARAKNPDRLIGAHLPRRLRCGKHQLIEVKRHRGEGGQCNAPLSRNGFDCSRFGAHCLHHRLLKERMHIVEFGGKEFAVFIHSRFDARGEFLARINVQINQ